jgi:hypothetical protein
VELGDYWHFWQLSMKFIVFWDVVPCSHIEVDRHTEIHTTSIFSLMMEAVHTSETSVHFNVTTWCYIPEDYKLHTCHRENLKSHNWVFKLYFIFHNAQPQVTTWHMCTIKVTQLKLWHNVIQCAMLNTRIQN